MVRPLRIEYPGAWYHVMNRGRRGEQIFLEERDYKTFLELLIAGATLLRGDYREWIIRWLEPARRGR